MSRKIKLYIVDIEEKTVSRLDELFYDNPQLGIKMVGHSHNYTSCINDLSRAKEADVYLISAFLPDQMGIYLIEKIRKVNPEGKIIIMVSSSTRNQAEIAKEKGADEIVLKPFKAKNLIDTIYKLADSKEEEPEEEEELFASEDSNRLADEYSSNAPQKRAPQLNSFIDSEYGNLLDSNPSDSEPLIPSYDESRVDNENRKRFQISQAPIQDFSDEEENPFLKENQFLKETPVQKPMLEPEPINRRPLFEAYSENPIAQNIYQDTDEFSGKKPNSLVVFSSTSSAGKTTLLVNTAVAINKFSEYKPKICIVDFNLNFPSVLYKFHNDELIMPERNLFDIVEDKEILDEDLIKQALVTHEPTGIKILETPADSIRDISIINRDVIIPLFEKLRGMFDLILVDTSTNVRSDASSFPLTVSDKNIILLEPDLASLLHTRKFITMLKTVENALGEKITNKNVYVLNKDNAKTGIHVDTVKKSIHNNTVRLTIPEDVNLTHLSNNGQFVVHSSMNIAREIKELARIAYPLEKELSLSSKNNRKKKPKTSKFRNFFNR